MAYADFGGKIILHSWGRFRMKLAEACVVGDLVCRDGYLADADANRPAFAVACEDGAAAATIWVAKKVEVAKPSTIATGGVVTAGNHGGAADDVLWLSATAGKASALAVASIAQIVGLGLSTERVLLEPGEQWDEPAELIAGSTKTLDIEDCGKAMVCTITTVVTLPAVATGLNFVLVNGSGQLGVVQISVDPAAADMIKAPDVGGVDNKDYINTLATAKPGDRVELMYESVNGYIVTKQIGTWAAEA